MILLVFQFHGESILNLKDDGTGHAKQVKNTLIFNGFVFCQVGLPASQEAELNTKKLKMNILVINPSLQIFNEFNARKPDELNVFTGVLKNRLFVGIVGTTFVLQVGSRIISVPC